MSGVALKVSEGNNYVSFGVAGDGQPNEASYTFDDCTTDPAVQSAHGSGDTMQIENNPGWYTGGCCLAGAGAVALGQSANDDATNVYDIVLTGSTNFSPSVKIQNFIVDDAGNGVVLWYTRGQAGGYYGFMGINRAVAFEEVDLGIGGKQFSLQQGENAIVARVTLSRVIPQSDQDVPSTRLQIAMIASPSGRSLGGQDNFVADGDTPLNACTQIIHSTQVGVSTMGVVAADVLFGEVDEAKGGIYGGGARLAIDFPHDVKISGIYWPPSVPIVVPGGAPVQIYMPIGPDPILGTPNDSRLQWTRTILLDPHRINTGFIP